MAITDLVTRTEYKTYAGITVSDYDTQIDALITGLSLAIEKYCSTTFVIREVSQNWRYFDSPFSMGNGLCCGYTTYDGIWLYNYPVTSIVSIQDQAVPVNTIAATEYTLHPDIGLLQFYFIPIPVDGNGNESYWTITYNAGRFAATANVDANLKLACNMLISQVLDRPNPGIRSKTVGQLTLSYSGSSESLDIFEDVQILLSPYISQSVLFA